MLCAQITDLHVSLPGALLAGRSDTAGFLDRAVARLNGLDPRSDFVLVTGDLVEGGSEAEYRHLRARLAPLAMPVFLALGNHDAPAAFRATFDDLSHWVPSEPFLQSVLNVRGLVLLVAKA